MPRPLRYDPDNDFYTVLGVAPTATVEEVHRAYRQQAKLVHPDLNRERREWAHEQFQRLNNAHDILGDLTLRGDYDQKRRLYQETHRPGYKSAALTAASRAAWARRNRRRPTVLYYLSVGILAFGLLPFLYWFGESIQWSDQSESPTLPTSAPIIVVPQMNAGSACSDPDAMITEPRAGANIHNPFVIKGTAYGNQFSSYHIEVAYSYLLHRVGARAWIPLQRVTTVPVNNDLLVPETLTDHFPFLGADLTLRLTVTNADGTTLPECEVAFHLSNTEIATQAVSNS